MSFATVEFHEDFAKIWRKINRIFKYFLVSLSLTHFASILNVGSVKKFQLSAILGVNFRLLGIIEGLFDVYVFAVYHSLILQIGILSVMYLLLTRRVLRHQLAQ